MGNIHEKFDEHRKEIESTIKQIIPDEQEVSLLQLCQNIRICIHPPLGDQV